MNQHLPKVALSDGGRLPFDRYWVSSAGNYYAGCPECRLPVRLGKRDDGTLDLEAFHLHMRNAHEDIEPAGMPTSEEVARCPVCGDFIDYCGGHGRIGDPEGNRRLRLHDKGNHALCDPRGCDDARR